MTATSTSPARSASRGRRAASPRHRRGVLRRSPASRDVSHQPRGCDGVRDAASAQSASMPGSELPWPYLHVVRAGRKGQVVADRRERYVGQDGLPVHPDIDVGASGDACTTRTKASFCAATGIARMATSPRPRSSRKRAAWCVAWVCSPCQAVPRRMPQALYSVCIAFAPLLSRVCTRITIYEACTPSKRRLPAAASGSRCSGRESAGTRRRSDTHVVRLSPVRRSRDRAPASDAPAHRRRLVGASGSRSRSRELRQRTRSPCPSRGAGGDRRQPAGQLGGAIH